MPLKVFEFTPSSLNASNDAAVTGFVNVRTGQPVNAGGLTTGDCIPISDREAMQLSNTATGLLFAGNYRRIQVDANATAANVAKGKIAYVVPGSSVLGAVILTAGTGQTPGTYNVASSGGGGTGAVIQVVVAAGGTVTATPTLVTPGSGYTSTPTFTLASGGTPATFSAQMVVNSFIVTTADVSGVNTSQPRGVFLNTVTPGNYGWLQETGFATVLQAATVTSATVGAIVTPVAGGNGTVQATVSSAAPLPSAIGTAVDVPVANAYYRVLLNLPTWAG